VTKRNPVAVLLLALVTLGIYAIIWIARSRGEMVARGAAIPTTWLIIVPIANLIYYWKWSKGVEHVTGGTANGVVVFILMLFLGPVGYIYAQSQFNKVGGTVSAAPVTA
jgi:hypothetical protein